MGVSLSESLGKILAHVTAASQALHPPELAKTIEAQQHLQHIKNRVLVLQAARFPSPALPGEVEKLIEELADSRYPHQQSARDALREAFASLTRERDEAQSLWNQELERRVRGVEKGRYFTHDEAMCVARDEPEILRKSLLDEREKRTTFQRVATEMLNALKGRAPISEKPIRRWEAELEAASSLQETPD